MFENSENQNNQNNFIKSTRQWINNIIDLEDIFCFGGLAMLGYGLWQISPILTYTICGTLLMLLGLGWLHCRRGATK